MRRSGARVSGGPESRDDQARGDSGFASSTRPGMTRTHAPAMQESEKHRMQSTSWTPEHSSALQEYLAKGMSYSRSEEHTSELQSLRHLVCRLLLEKKK